MADMRFSVRRDGTTLAALYSPALRTFYEIRTAFVAGLFSGENLSMRFFLVREDYHVFRRLDGRVIEVTKSGRDANVQGSIILHAPGGDLMYGGLPDQWGFSISSAGRPFQFDGTMFRRPYQAGIRSLP